MPLIVAVLRTAVIAGSYYVIYKVVENEVREIVRDELDKNRAPDQG